VNIDGVYEIYDDTDNRLRLLLAYVEKQEDDAGEMSAKTANDIAARMLSLWPHLGPRR
jgi:hypothetical protein